MASHLARTRTAYSGWSILYTPLPSTYDWADKQWNGYLAHSILNGLSPTSDSTILCCEMFLLFHEFQVYLGTLLFATITLSKGEIIATKGNYKYGINVDTLLLGISIMCFAFDKPHLYYLPPQRITYSSTILILGITLQIRDAQVQIL